SSGKRHTITTDLVPIRLNGSTAPSSLRERRVATFLPSGLMSTLEIFSHGIVHSRDNSEGGGYCGCLKLMTFGGWNAISQTSCAVLRHGGGPPRASWPDSFCTLPVSASRMIQF